MQIWSRILIGFNDLGNMGWLGNQMFQYASLQGIARHHGYDFAIPPSDGTQAHSYGLSNIFVLKNCNNFEYVNGETLVCDKFEFNENLFENCPDNVNIRGFFQTDKYFSHIKDKIVEDLTFKNPCPNPYGDFISVHVRRGDYLHQDYYHPVLNLDYYRRALSELNSDLPVVVFSDDINWCKENITFATYFSEDRSRQEDLYLMTIAKHNIIANSSFSWWGSWLNNTQDKITICPKKWFGLGYLHYNMNDIRPKEWIQL